MSPLKRADIYTLKRCYYVHSIHTHLTHTIDSPWCLSVFPTQTGHKIPTIENLGVAGPQDAIDFTDNDLTTLANFPLSPRLNTLLCARNRIQTVDRRVAEQIPNLTTLVLTANRVRELGDLEGLSRCNGLVHLSLLENPVTKKEVSCIICPRNK